MATKKTLNPLGLSDAGRPISTSTEQVYLRSATPEGDLLQSAEALREILEYVRQQSDSHKFGELSLFVETAQTVATELVDTLSKGNADD